MLEALRRLINLLKEAGFTSGMFNAQNLLEFNHDRVIAAVQSLFKTFSPLPVILIPLRQPDPANRYHGSTDDAADYDGSSSTPINDSLKDGNTGSSRYASAESEEDSNDSFEIQRMSLGPKGADLLRKTFERNAAEAQAGRPSAMQFMNMVKSEQVNFYFRAAMKNKG